MQRLHERGGHVEVETEPDVIEAEPGAAVTARGPRGDRVLLPVRDPLGAQDIVESLDAQLVDDVGEQLRGPAEPGVRLDREVVDGHAVDQRVVLQEDFESHHLEAASHRGDLELAEEGDGDIE